MHGRREDWDAMLVEVRTVRTVRVVEYDFSASHSGNIVAETKTVHHIVLLVSVICAHVGPQPLGDVGHVREVSSLDRWRAYVDREVMSVVVASRMVRLVCARVILGGQVVEYERSQVEVGSC